MQIIKRIPLILLFVMIIAVLLIILSFVRKEKFWVNTNQAAVVKEMRELQRLETAQFTIEKIIDAGTTGNGLKQFLFGDKILLIAHGEVIAGFDFSQLSDKDVTVTNNNITLRLPKPQILVTRIDSSKTRVYDRKQGILSKGEKDLETEARKEAEISIHNAACQADILNTASTNARKQLGALLKSFGFNEVTIIIPQASC